MIIKMHVITLKINLNILFNTKLQVLQESINEIQVKRNIFKISVRFRYIFPDISFLLNIIFAL